MLWITVITNVVYGSILADPGDGDQAPPPPPESQIWSPQCTI